MIGEELREVPLGFFEEFREYSELSKYQEAPLQKPFVERSNPVCGDQVKIRLEIDDCIITSYRYQQQGCWPVVGCLELLGELFSGARVEEVLEFGLKDFLALVRDIPASKHHAFSLTHRVCREALGQAVASKATM